MSSGDRSARSLMIQGTGSGVGKSYLAAALCRAFVRRGIDVRPFKAQNMSNNAAVTSDGGEIGRAQALQARAARVVPDTRMNPVLLKPMSDRRCEVVVRGRGRPELQRVPWHERPAHLWPEVRASFESLEAECELMIVEGAGSPAETNLRASDIVNMAVAREWRIPTLLVADIDRGGAFAALYGTWVLVEPEDRALFSGFVLNKFRGDPALLEPAPSDLERRTGVATVGVIPFERHLLPDEDAQTLERVRGGHGTTIAAIRLPHLSNYDDLDPLLAEPSVRLRWVTDPGGLEGAAAIVVPGTRSTLADLAWLRSQGLDRAIREADGRGVPVLGLCGGLQMMGSSLADPDRIEGADIHARGAGERECEPGLGLLPLRTTLLPEKTVRRFTGLVRIPRVGESDGVEVPLSGYEIHHGSTHSEAPVAAWIAEDGRVVGYGSGSRLGTYLHGIFENDGFRRVWLRSVGCPVDGSVCWGARLDAELDRVADLVEGALDLDRLWALADTSP